MYIYLVWYMSAEYDERNILYYRNSHVIAAYANKGNADKRMKKEEKILLEKNNKIKYFNIEDIISIETIFVDDLSERGCDDEEPPHYGIDELVI